MSRRTEDLPKGQVTTLSSIPKVDTDTLGIHSSEDLSLFVIFRRFVALAVCAACWIFFFAVAYQITFEERGFDSVFVIWLSFSLISSLFLASIGNQKKESKEDE